MDIKRNHQFQLGHRLEIDGFRGIAILLVLLHHAGIPFIHGGHIGVDIFFVLSGFLITVLLYQEYLRFENISLKRFYIRRFLRLMPALFGLLVVFTAFTLVTKSGSAIVKSEQAILITALYLSDFAIAFGYATLGGLGHTWSLAIEEHFYLIYPVILVFLLRKTSSIRTTVIVLSALVIIITFNRVFLWGPGTQEVTRVYYGFDTRGDGLLIGCILGLLAASGRLPIVKPLLAIAALAILVLALIFADWDSRLYAYGLTLINFSTAIALTYVLISPVGWLTNRLLVWIGVMSYGLYLWHNLIFIIVRERLTGSPWGVLVLGSIISVVCAALSYYLIEKPFLKFKEQFAPSVPKKGQLPGEVLNAPAQ